MATGSTTASDQKKAEIIAFLRERVFDPILTSPQASNRLKQGVRATIMRMGQLDPQGMVRYYWTAVVGTDRSIKFAKDMRAEGFTRFEDPEVLEAFRVQFRPETL